MFKAKRKKKWQQTTQTSKSAFKLSIQIKAKTKFHAKLEEKKNELLLRLKRKVVKSHQLNLKTKRKLRM